MPVDNVNSYFSNSPWRPSATCRKPVDFQHGRLSPTTGSLGALAIAGAMSFPLLDMQDLYVPFQRPGNIAKPVGLTACEAILLRFDFNQAKRTSFVQG